MKTNRKVKVLAMSIESCVKLMTAGPERFDNIFVFINLENCLRSCQPERITPKLEEMTTFSTVSITSDQPT